MSRAKNHSIKTKDFTSYVKSYFDRYHEISERFREETKGGGRVSKTTINDMTKLYNSSNLREKYILALSEQEEKLERSMHVEASKYLKEVRARLDALYKKDLPGFKSSGTVSKDQWLDFNREYSESAKRNKLRDAVKGGTPNIHSRIKGLLGQGQKLNRDHVKDDDLGDIFFRIHKEIRGRNRMLYAGGAALGAIGVIVAATLELRDHFIGNKDFIEDDVTKTDTDTDVGEGSENGGGGESGEGSETGGDGYENGTEIVTQTQVFQALQYAILIAIIVMVVIIVVATITTICAQMERERLSHNKAPEAEVEKLDGKEKRKESRNEERVKFIEEVDGITSKSR